MIHIVNWLLTRRCNLQCSYCRISNTSYELTRSYPPLKHYFQNEMDTDFILSSLDRLTKHNPNCFHIFYGGEPLLRDDLPEIVQYCHDNKIYYTIITNNSEQVQKRIANLFDKVGHLEGLTSSIDPVIFDKSATGDIVKKSLAGLERLYQYRDKVKDLVAEITVDKYNLKYLYDLLKELTNRGISSSITFIDITKSVYYDFSNVTDESLLVSKEEVFPVLMKIDDDDDLNIHMKELLPKIYQSLPSDYNCKIEETLSTLTIDGDGTLRTCIRLRGIHTPSLKLFDYIDKNGEINELLKENLKLDKKKYCLKCNWTCPQMAELVETDNKNLEENLSSFNDLVHSERRK